MYTKTMANAKRILIETETTETLRLTITGPYTKRSHCTTCGRIEEMLDLNSAADISGTPARELIALLQNGQLHSPESDDGHLLVCRASLEDAINRDDGLRPATLRLQESL